MPSFVPRLGFRTGPRLPAGEVDVPGFLSQAENTAIFMDSSVVRRKIEYPFWDEMLRVPRRVMLAKPVVQELVPHFEAVPGHPLGKAILASNPALQLKSAPEMGSPGAKAFLYYLNLLITRRFVLERRIQRHVRETGAQPDREQRKELEAEIQRDFGERGFLLCKKPLSPIFTDEILVYVAIEHALRTGQPTMIMTDDHDVEEQFMKAIELVTIHYFAMLVAREYRRDPLAFRPRPVNVDVAGLRGMFESLTLLDLNDRRVQDFRPPEITFVPISCVMVGDYVSHLTYGAETAMADVLDLKDRTSGKATDLFGERDVHAYFVPEIAGISEPFGALISRDVCEEVGDGELWISELDKLAAIHTGLNMSPVVPTSSSPSILTRQSGRTQRISR